MASYIYVLKTHTKITNKLNHFGKYTDQKAIISFQVHAESRKHQFCVTFILFWWKNNSEWNKWKGSKLKYPHAEYSLSGTIDKKKIKKKTDFTLPSLYFFN